MSSSDLSPAGEPAKTQASDFRRLWRLTVRNLIFGSLISVLPAFVFYSVAFSYSSEQVGVLFKIFPLTVVASLAVDLSLNWWYLAPCREFERGAGGREFPRIYERLHNLPLFSFVRVFGPHSVVASGVAQLSVLFANARWNLGIPSRDYGVYWLLNLTLVPIGHAVFEYHANGWAAREELTKLAAAATAGDRGITRVWRVGLAKRLAVFYFLLAVSPLILLATAIRRWPLPAAAFPVAFTDLAKVVAGVTVLNLLLLLLFALDVHQQTRTLLDGFERVEKGDLATRVDLFSPDEFGVVSEGVNNMIRGLRDRQRIRDLFGLYVSPEVSEAILDGQVSLEGEAREVSVLFCDIRDFTRFSTSRAPREVVDRLNQFFSRVSRAIHAHGGTINKFLGDGFLAVFGAPVGHADHPRRAVQAALQMEAGLAAFNAELEERGEPALEIGIGIDSGQVIAGNVGSPDRLEYTVIGDPVNRSSRIEQLNKTFGTRILISARTYKCSGLAGGRALAPVTVKGIEEPIEVVAVGARAEAA